MPRRLSVVLLSTALVLAPATASFATGGGNHHGNGGGSSYNGGSSAELCGGKRQGDVIPWASYDCEKATAYYLYEKTDHARNAGWSNSGVQHRVALLDVWAWPTEDGSVRYEGSYQLPVDPEIVPLELPAEDVELICADPTAYGVQVDLAGNGIAGRELDLPSVIPTDIAPPDGGFHTPNTLAYYGHYNVTDVVDVEALCAPQPTEEPTPEPTTPVGDEETSTPQPVDTPEPTVEPTVEPTPVEEVDADEPTPTPTADVVVAEPTPSPTSTSDVLAATGDDETLAATGSNALIGGLAAIVALAVGGALVLVRRRAAHAGR